MKVKFLFKTLCLRRHRILLSLNFLRKGLILCNSNVRHILPKIVDIRILMSSEQGPDIVGMCETFLKKNNPDIVGLPFR